MKRPHATRSLTHPGNYSLALALGWTFAIALSLCANGFGLRKEIMTIAQSVARAYVDRDILYRNWNALHGGVYVPVTAGMPPNPYYPPSMPERDVVTPSGRVLTFVNPAYMTRQIYDLAQGDDRASGRITSLKPLNPANGPGRWEAAALGEFERGRKEVSGRVSEGGKNYLRLMRPLVTEESCLGCHARQGYRKGDIRGGISIRMPMAMLDAALDKQLGLLAVGHGAIWLLGLCGLVCGVRGA